MENNEVRKKRFDELQKVLYSQEYPQNLIQEAIRKATSIPIENLGATIAKTDSNNLAFVTTFNPKNKNFFPLIQAAFKSLQQSNETKEGFKDIKLIKSQRQPSSLKKLLTRAIYPTKQEHCSKKFSKTRCACCDYIKESSFHTFKTTRDIFYVKKDMTCERSNLVYVVICSTCNEEYIGETGEGKTRVRDRVRVYRQHIHQYQYQQLKYQKHFQTCGKGEFKIFPFFKLIRRINT